MQARCAVAGTITAVTEQPRPTGDQDLVVDMRDVVVRRGDTTLLSSVNWQVELDERWVVLGPNGAGKTTLLRLAGAELHPSAGVVHVLGERLGGADVFELRPRIGFCSSAFNGRMPDQERVRDLVMTAGYAVLGRWHEPYDGTDSWRADGVLAAFDVAGLA